MQDVHSNIGTAIFKIEAYIGVLGIQDIFSSRDMVYYPFYFQDNRSLCWIFRLLSGNLKLKKIIYGDIYQLIRDTCLFTSRDILYW